jgi:hypothetical protein
MGQVPLYLKILLTDIATGLGRDFLRTPLSVVSPETLESDWSIIAEQPARAPHLAHPALDIHPWIVCSTHAYFFTKPWTFIHEFAVAHREAHLTQCLSSIVL